MQQRNFIQRLMPDQVLSRKMDCVILKNLSSQNCYLCKKSLGGTGSIFFFGRAPLLRLSRVPTDNQHPTLKTFRLRFKFE